MARSPHVVFLRGDESEVQRRMWRGPCALCFRGGDCKAAYERSGFGGITPSGGGWCCSGTAEEGLAWRWSSRCSAVCILRFPIDAGGHLEVLGDYIVVEVLGGAAGSCSAAFAV